MSKSTKIQRNNINTEEQEAPVQKKKKEYTIDELKEINKENVKKYKKLDTEYKELKKNFRLLLKSYESLAYMYLSDKSLVDLNMTLDEYNSEEKKEDDKIKEDNLIKISESLQKLNSKLDLSYYEKTFKFEFKSKKIDVLTKRVKEYNKENVSEITDGTQVNNDQKSSSDSNEEPILNLRNVMFIHKDTNRYIRTICYHRREEDQLKYSKGVKLFECRYSRELDNSILSDLLSEGVIKLESNRLIIITDEPDQFKKRYLELYKRYTTKVK